MVAVLDRAGLAFLVVGSLRRRPLLETGHGLRSLPEGTEVRRRADFPRPARETARRSEVHRIGQGSSVRLPGLQGLVPTKRNRAALRLNRKPSSDCHIERFFLSLKDEWLRRILVPLRHEDMRRELSCYLCWFEHSRPHQGLDGRNPREVYDGRSVVEKARPKAKEVPRAELIVRFHEGRKQLPIVELRRAA